MLNSTIAIVGMACQYPDATSPAELWENVLSQRRAFRRLPEERLRLDDYFSTDRNAPDMLYSTQAAVLKDYEFDRVHFRVAGTTYRSADLTHWLALDVAAQALADAGFPEGEGLPDAMTGVLLGNTLTGEFSRANLTRLRWPYVRRVVDAALAEKEWSPEDRSAFLGNLEEQYKAPFPPIGEESLAGGLSNTIAGRICNHFDLNGGGYTVDGACASSLLAVTNACSALVVGDLDVALAGGVDLSLDPFELIGFAKTSALAPEKMRVFDAQSAGFWPGEGCGFVVLMRHEDAIAQNRRIYALIRGWGVSSDGSGGITRPEVGGQRLALQRAYDRAGYTVDTVGYFEAHGTGTAVGDGTELRTISSLLEEAQAHDTAEITDPPSTQSLPAVIGTVKANFGHTKAAAGLAGVIKASLALHKQVLPPTTGVDEPHSELTVDHPVLRVLMSGESWPADRPLRAGVNAMGFGGINTHIALEGVAEQRRRSLTGQEKTLFASVQDAELYLLSAKNVAELQAQIAHLHSFVAQISLAEMADLAAELSRTLAYNPVRAALVATTPAELADRLRTLHTWLANGTTERLDSRVGLFISNNSKLPRIGFLFPGQGTASHLDGGALRRRFDEVAQLYDQSNFGQNGHRLDAVATSVAQPAIVTASVAALRVLSQLGIEANVGVGHSLGEITALHWAGGLDEATVLNTAKIRGQAMMDLSTPTGTMASIGAGRIQVATLLNGDDVSIACLNTPEKTVISGEKREVETIVSRAQTQGLAAVNLAVSHAFHSPLVAAAVQPLATYLDTINFHPLQQTIVSTIRGKILPSDEDLRVLLCDQVTAPVQFTEALTQAADSTDLFIEVGPGQTLSGLAAESVATPAIAIDAGGPSLRGLLHAVGAAFALGAPVNHRGLFAQRFTRPFDLDWHPSFFANPCEMAPTLNGNSAPIIEIVQAESTPESAEATDQEKDEPAQETVELVRRLIAERIELPLSSVQDSDKLLSDLHLNSITVTQIVAEAARKIELNTPVSPTDFADVTVRDVAETLDEIARNGGGASDQERQPVGVDSWVRSFSVDWVERVLPHQPSSAEAGEWQIIAPDNHPLAATLRNAFAADDLTRVGGEGVVICLPAQPDEAHLFLLLQGAHAALAAEGSRHFVLVQQNGGGAALARTLHLEEPRITTRVVNLPLDHPQAADWVVAEARFAHAAAHDYVESRYDETGQRYERALRLLPLDQDLAELPFGADDVLLVTGGGKGITAECALSLAQKTGVRLALLGRSQPEDDEELTSNLARMTAADVEFRYFATDVTDADAVSATVQEVTTICGPVTAILHGAARNVPQLLGDLDVETIKRTLAPKVTGMRNLLDAVDPEKLRLIIGFGSIIAETGLPGETDYGLANEWLERLLDQYQQAHPNCRTLTVNWSVWAGAGMGERLGILDNLAKQGITPIPLDQGVEMLQSLLKQPAANLPTAVVVAGRSGELPTLQMAKPTLPFLRFVDQVRVHYPGIELVVDIPLSGQTDPYLDDHAFRGDRLFPAVMGLEAMSQVAMALAGSDEPPILEDVQLTRPVVVPEDAIVTVRVAALLRTSGQVEVALRTQETGYQADHFRAICRFDITKPDLADISTSLEKFPSLKLDVQNELYGSLLFQEGRFQRLQGYREMSAHQCLAVLNEDKSATWFDRTLPGTLVLDDSGVRDVVMHALQVCMPQATLLPIGVERLTVGIGNGSSDLRYIYAHERITESTADTFVFDVAVADAAGAVHEQWQGLRLKKISGMDFTGPWSAPVLGPYLERRLHGLASHSFLRVAVERDGNSVRQARSNLAIQRALLDRISVQRRPDGRPEVAGEWHVSAAHSDDLTMAVAGPIADGPISCDMERVVSRTESVWHEMLGDDRFQLTQLVAQETDAPLDAAATRVWTAYECLHKAGAALDTPLTLDSVQVDGWVTIAAGSQRVATGVLNVHGVDEPLVVAVLRSAQGKD